MVLAVEAGDVAVAQLEVAGERVAETAEVGRLARLEPGLLAERGGVRHLAGQLRRDPGALLEVAPDPVQQPRVVGVGIGSRRPRLERVEQPADRGVDELLVADPLERGRVVGAADGARAGHHGVLVPEQEREGGVEVDELGHAALEVAERGRRSGQRPALAKTSSSSGSGRSSPKCSLR